jgi:hypothetical protein
MVLSPKHRGACVDSRLKIECTEYQRGPEARAQNRTEPG